MKAVPLKAFPRTLTRRAGSKRLRSAGRVPAVMYGRTIQPRNLEVSAKQFQDMIHHSASATVLVDLAVEGEDATNQLALVQEIQRHPLSGSLLHVDLHQVAADERVTVTLPLESVGQAPGVKAGGVLEHVLFNVKVTGLPNDLPDRVEVDVSELQVGQTVLLGDIRLPDGVTVVGDKSIPVLAVAAPLTEAQEEAALETATGAPTEPEMLREKKDAENAESAKKTDSAKK
jgi:large subunit ribosomal protein L25